MYRNDEKCGSPKLDAVYIERRTTKRRKPTDWVLYTKRKPGSQKLFFLSSPVSLAKRMIAYRTTCLSCGREKISASSCKTQKLSTNLSSEIKSRRDVEKDSRILSPRFLARKKNDNETRTKWQFVRFSPS